VSPPASKFLSFEENGGAFHWAIVAAGADRLAPSATFASYEQATQAAGVVRTGAVSAPFDKRAGDPAPLEPAAGRRQRSPTIWTQSVGWMRAAASAARR